MSEVAPHTMFGGGGKSTVVQEGEGNSCSDAEMGEEKEKLCCYAQKFEIRKWTNGETKNDK